MIVMKFGGSSVESAAAIQRVAGIVKARAERHPVDRYAHALDEKRHGADVILMTVREKKRAEFRRGVEDVRQIGNDDVDAERRGVGKHHAAVDDDGLSAVLVDHAVHSDFGEAAEWNDA